MAPTVGIPACLAHLTSRAKASCVNRSGTSCWATVGKLAPLAGMEVPESSALHPHTHRAASEVSGVSDMSGEGLRAQVFQGGCMCEKKLPTLSAFLPVYSP